MVVASPVNLLLLMESSNLASVLFFVLLFLGGLFPALIFDPVLVGLAPAAALYGV